MIARSYAAMAALTLVSLAGAGALSPVAAAPPGPGAREAGAYSAPRNAFGQPDLEGLWTNVTLTRLERDPRFGDKLVLSDHEVAEIEARARAAEAKGAAQDTSNRSVVEIDMEDCGNGTTGVACGYNYFWIDQGQSVMRIGGEARSSILVEPRDGRMPPLTEAAQARVRSRWGTAEVGNFDGPERRPLGERCLLSFDSSAGPPMLPLMYNNNYQIVQTADTVAIVVEMVHDVRIIRLNAKHGPASVRQWMGDSVGRWEGDTLVVETVNLRPEQSFRGAGPNLKVIERLTRISPTQIHYQFELIDPESFTAPVKGEVAFNASKEPMYEYACHEGNYALPGILAGARLEEREGREAEGNRGEIKSEADDQAG